jgi:hypothetical protein
MVEINLLPWRDAMLAEIRKKCVLGGICCLFILLIFFLGWQRYHSNQYGRDGQTQSPLAQRIHHEKMLLKRLRQIKFIGYLRQGSRSLGILLWPNGKIQDVQEGAFFSEDQFRVMKMSENSILILLPSQHLVSLPFSRW